MISSNDKEEEMNIDTSITGSENSNKCNMNIIEEEENNKKTDKVTESTIILSEMEKTMAKNKNKNKNKKKQEAYLVNGLDVPCVYYLPQWVTSDKATKWYEQLIGEERVMDDEIRNNGEIKKWNQSARLNRWTALYTFSPSTTKKPDDDNNNNNNNNISEQDSKEEKKMLNDYRYRDDEFDSESILEMPTTLKEIRQSIQRTTLWMSMNDDNDNDNDDNPKYKEWDEVPMINDDKHDPLLEFNICLCNYYADGTNRIGWHYDREEIGRTTPIASVSLGAHRTFQLQHKKTGKKHTIQLQHGSLLIMDSICQEEYVHCVPSESSIHQPRLNLTFRCKTFTTTGELQHQRQRQREQHKQQKLQQQKLHKYTPDTQLIQSTSTSTSTKQQDSSDNAYIQKFTNNSTSEKIIDTNHHHHHHHHCDESQTSSARKSNSSATKLLLFIGASAITATRTFNNHRNNNNNNNNKSFIAPFLLSSFLATSTICYHYYYNSSPTKKHNSAIINRTYNTEITHVLMAQPGLEKIVANEVKHILTSCPQLVQKFPFLTSDANNTYDHPHWVVIRPWNCIGYVGLCLKDILHSSKKQKSILPFFKNDTTTKGTDYKVILENLLVSLRSITHVTLHHGMFKVQFPDKNNTKDNDTNNSTTATSVPIQVYEKLKDALLTQKITIPTLLPISSDDKTDANPSITFRVCSQRLGTNQLHPSTSVLSSTHIEREAGGAILEVFASPNNSNDGPVTGVSCDLKNPQVIIQCDIVNDVITIGSRLLKNTTQDMSKRHKYAYVNRVTVKSNVAFALLQFANIQPTDTILDPFCGGGTILLEAADYFSSTAITRTTTEHNNDSRVQYVGLDVQERAIEGARANAKVCGVDEKIEFYRADARGMERALKNLTTNAVEITAFDYIVTNLPWGMQTARNSNLSDLYEKFFRQSWHVVRPGGKVVIFVLHGMLTLQLIRSKFAGRFRILHTQVIKTKNSLPSILVLERCPRDDLYLELKRQLWEFNDYVNMPASIFQAIHGWDNEDDNYSQNSEREGSNRKKQK